MLYIFCKLLDFISKFIPWQWDMTFFPILASSSFRQIQEMESMQQDDQIDGQQMYVFQPYKLKRTRRNALKWPAPRSGHRAVCTESNLYCLGGFNPGPGEHRARRRHRRVTSLFQELWAFNFATKKWRLCLNYHAKDMPEELASNAIAAINDLVIAYGGTGYPFGEACSNQCYVFSTKRPSVARLKVEGDMPTPQYGPAIVLHNNYLYTIGGTTGFEYSCDVHRLDLITRRWETVYLCRPERDDPLGRYRHEVVYTGKLVYILGGGTAQIAFDLVNLPVFDIEKNCWSYVETKADPSFKNTSGYPEPRRCHSCIQYNTDNGIDAVIAGGCRENNKYYDDIWKLNFKTLQWTFLPTAKLPYPIYFHSAATPGNGCMYVFGGIEYRQNNLFRTNDLYKMWTTIPKLSEICWDALCHYNRNLDEFSKEELVRYGIPMKFVNRILDNGNAIQRSS